jgi:hypothetical protein
MSKSTLRYYMTGLPGAFREVLAWAQRPEPLYWLVITIWFYPFLAYIALTVQAHDNVALSKLRRVHDETR